jgi:hypothetical protein
MASIFARDCSLFVCLGGRIPFRFRGTESVTGIGFRFVRPLIVGFGGDLLHFRSYSFILPFVRYMENSLMAAVIAHLEIF